MRKLVCIASTALALVACGGGRARHEPAAAASASIGAGEEQAPAQGAGSGAGESAGEGTQPGEFVLRKSGEGSGASSTAGAGSKLKGNATHAAMKFIVVDKDKGPIPGIVIVMTAPDGTRYYTEETDAEGYAEVLVPNGQKYEIVYLSLGRKDIAASVPVTDEPNQNIRLTLRYKRYTPPPRKAAASSEPAEPGFILGEVTFDTGKATIRDESYAQLDGVAEYLMHKKSARIEISGHTDNVGNPKANKALSLKRAEACREYILVKGVEPERVTAVGYGDERPIAPNDTELGRQKNRRIEAIEL